MDRLDEIRKRLLATTPGAWGRISNGEDWDDDEGDDWVVCTEDGQYIAQTSYDGLSPTTRETCKADAVFIAHAKEDIDYLLRELEKFKGQAH